MQLERMYVEDVPDGAVCYLQQYDHPDDWGIKVGDVFLSNEHAGLWRTADRLRNTPYEKYIGKYKYGWFTSFVWVETEELGVIE